MEILIGVVPSILSLLAAWAFAAHERAQLQDRVAAERKEWADERRELLNRIQHPERMPVKTTAGRTSANISPDARRALHQVGQVAPQTVTDGD